MVMKELLNSIRSRVVDIIVIISVGYHGARLRKPRDDILIAS